MRYSRRLGLAAFALIAVLAQLPRHVAAQSPAAGEGEKAACIDAHAKGQELRHAKKLRAAKDQLLSCSTRSCPPAILRECASLLEVVTSELPTLALSVVLQSGAAVTDASVLIDGQPWSELGVAREIDPGVHELRVTHPVHGEHARVITVLEGKQAQSVVMEIGASTEPPAPPKAAVTPEPERSLVPPAGAFIFFGLSAAALATGTALGVMSLDLEEAAASQDDLDELEKVRLGADLSFGGAGLFAAVGVVWWIVDATATTSQAAATRAPVFVEASASGDGGWVGVRFTH